MGSSRREVGEIALSTETVESAAGALEGVDNVKRRHRFPLSVLSVGDAVTDDLKNPKSTHVSNTCRKGNSRFQGRS